MPGTQAVTLDVSLDEERPQLWFLRIEPSGRGLPTIFDKDILIFCIGQLMRMKDQGRPIGKRVRFSTREMMIVTNRKTGGVEYQRQEQAQKIAALIEDQSAKPKGLWARLVGK